MHERSFTGGLWGWLSMPAGISGARGGSFPMRSKASGRFRVTDDELSFGLRRIQKAATTVGAAAEPKCLSWSSVRSEHADRLVTSISDIATTSGRRPAHRNVVGSKPKPAPRWVVILCNDDLHSIS